MLFSTHLDVKYDEDTGFENELLRLTLVLWLVEEGTLALEVEAADAADTWFTFELVAGTLTPWLVMAAEVTDDITVVALFWLAAETNK